MQEIQPAGPSGEGGASIVNFADYLPRQQDETVNPEARAFIREQVWELLETIPIEQLEEIVARRRGYVY